MRVSQDTRTEGRCTGLGGLAGKSKQLKKKTRTTWVTAKRVFSTVQGDTGQREGDQTCAEDLGTFLLDVHPSS